MKTNIRFLELNEITVCWTDSIYHFRKPDFKICWFFVLSSLVFSYFSLLFLLFLPIYCIWTGFVLFPNSWVASLSYLFLPLLFLIMEHSVLLSSRGCFCAPEVFLCWFYFISVPGIFIFLSVFLLWLIHHHVVQYLWVFWLLEIPLL